MTFGLATLFGQEVEHFVHDMDVYDVGATDFYFGRDTR